MPVSHRIVEIAAVETRQLHGISPIPWSWALLLRTTESLY
jgi:hypothetical protein